jgi:hypothetical protein
MVRPQKEISLFYERRRSIPGRVAYGHDSFGTNVATPIDGMSFSSNPLVNIGCSCARLRPVG